MDMLATAVLHFTLDAVDAAEARTRAERLFDQAIEDSDLLGGGGFGTVVIRTPRFGEASTYLATGVGLFRVLVESDDDSVETASERLKDELQESTLFTMGAVCGVVDD
jgi:hypothetical protein